MEYVLLYPLPKFLCCYKSGLQEVGGKKNPTNKPKPIFPFLCVEQNAFYLPTVPPTPPHPWVDLEFNAGTKT